MTAPNIPEGLGAILGVSDEAASVLLSINGWSGDITLDDLAEWGRSGDVPDPVVNALGAGIVPVTVLIHFGSSIEDIHRSMVEKSLLPASDDYVPVPHVETEVDEDEVDEIALRVIDEIRYDMDSGRTDAPRIYVIGDMLFKSMGEDKLEILNFFPHYPSEDDLGDDFIEGAAEFFTVRDGFQPDDRVMLPSSSSFVTSLAREIDPAASHFLVTWMVHTDGTGRTIINQFGVEVGDDYTTYDAASMAMLAEKKHLSGGHLTVSIRSLDGPRERTGSWYCRDGVTLSGVTGEESSFLRQVPGLGADDAVGVDTTDHSVVTLPREVRFIPVHGGL